MQLAKKRRAGVCEAPAATALDQWAALTPALLDLCAQHLETRERFVLVERVCVAWRLASARGAGWGHSLDLLALGADATWANVNARLGVRVQLHRLGSLTCHCELLVQESPLPDADSKREPDAASATPTAAAAAAEPRRVAVTCTHLAVANTRGLYSLAALDLKALFPVLVSLDVVLDSRPANVVRALRQAPQTAVFVGNGGETDAALLEAMVHHGMRDERFVTRIIELPAMPQVEHLRLAGGGWTMLENGAPLTAPAVAMCPDTPELRSLQTFGSVEVRGPVRTPRLEHLVLRAFTSGPTVERLVGAASKTLVALVLAAELGAARDFHVVLGRCVRLRALHMLSFAQRGAEFGRELPAVVARLAAGGGALEHVGLYCCSAAAAAWGAPRCQMLDMHAATTLRRLTLVDLSCAPDGRWRRGAIHNPARTSYVHYGGDMQCCSKCLLSPLVTPLTVSKCCE